MVADIRPSIPLPLDVLKNSPPQEQEGNVYRWRSTRRFRVNSHLVKATIEAQRAAIESGSGAFSITLEIGSQSKARRETWEVLTNRKGDVPLVDLYLQATTQNSLLLPKVSEPSKIARVHGAETQLFSPHREEFDAANVSRVLSTIDRITRRTLQNTG